ncbi:MAG: peptidoglycan bridge formation glycyltransferase FemA/FemB family protein [Solobacterium sp.]|nr:peptidoglycan bridge formation glycyltransferase FemA/FemB family protein [Solobacterium sp.]
MSKLTFIENLDPALNDAFVIQSSQNSLFQTSLWAELKNTTWNPFFVGIKRDDVLCASAMVLVRKLLPGKTLMYIPRGPVMDYEDEELVEYMFSSLRAYAKKLHSIAVRFDPCILVRKYPYTERKSVLPLENLDIIQKLNQLGIQHKGFTTLIEESTQPRFNAAMIVEEGYEKKLEHRTRKCINAAVKKGIILRSGREYLHDFAIAMHYTEVRKKVALRNEDYFRQMMDVFGEQCICIVSYLNFPEQIGKLEKRIAENQALLEGNLSKKKRNEITQMLEQDTKELGLLQADYEREQKEEVITGGIMACYNDRLMELFYMGNHPDYLRMYSSYLLYKTCLDLCVEKGIRYCSFGGIEGTLDDGLTLFKSNWLMDVEEYIGEFNMVIDRPVYYAFDRLYPLALKTAAKLRGRK